MWPVKTLDQLISDFDTLAASSTAGGRDLTALKADHTARNRARRWLSSNRNSVDGQEKSRNKQIESSTRTGDLQWMKLRNLDKKIRDKSAEEAPVRLFLLIAQLFSKFESNPMNFEEYKDTMQDETVTYYLRQTLENYGKVSYYEMGVENFKAKFSTWQIFWHLHWLREEVGMAMAFSML